MTQTEGLAEIERGLAALEQDACRILPDHLRRQAENSLSDQQWRWSAILRASVMTGIGVIVVRDGGGARLSTPHEIANSNPSAAAAIVANYATNTGCRLDLNATSSAAMLLFKTAYASLCAATIDYAHQALHALSSAAPPKRGLTTSFDIKAPTDTFLIDFDFVGERGETTTFFIPNKAKSDVEAAAALATPRAGLEQTAHQLLASIKNEKVPQEQEKEGKTSAGPAPNGIGTP